MLVKDVANKSILLNATKSEGSTQVLAYFGLHYFYLGQIGTGILYWILLLPTFGIWAFVDLFRAKKLARRKNAPLLQRIVELEKMEREEKQNERELQLAMMAKMAS